MCGPPSYTPVGSVFHGRTSGSAVSFSRPWRRVRRKEATRKGKLNPLFMPCRCESATLSPRNAREKDRREVIATDLPDIDRTI